MSYSPPSKANPQISNIWVRFASQLYSNTLSTEPAAVRAYFSQLKDQTLHQIDPDAGHASADSDERTLYQHILEQTAPGRTPNAQWISEGVRDAVVQKVRSYYSNWHLSGDNIIHCLNTAVRAKHTYQQAQEPARQQGGRGVGNRGAMRILWDEMEMSGADAPGGSKRSKQEFVKKTFLKVVSDVYDLLELRLQVGELTFDQLPEYARAWLQQRLPKEMGQDRTDRKVSECFNRAFTLVKEERERSATQPSISEQLIVEYEIFESYYTKARQLALEVYVLLREILGLERPKFDDAPGDMQLWLQQTLLKRLGQLSLTR